MRKLPRTAFLVFSLVRALPWLFPKGARLQSNIYIEHDIPPIRSIQDGIKEASLIVGDFSWKGLSFLTSIDDREAEAVIKWMDARRTALASDSAYSIPDKGLAMLGFQGRHLGLVPFNRYHEFHGAPLFLKSKFPGSCDVNIVSMPNGVSYLSLYFVLDKVATDEVHKVDVSEIKARQYFLSLNPFSKKFGIMTRHPKFLAVEDFLAQNARNVVSETHDAFHALCGLWKVKNKPGSYTVVSDVVAHSEESAGYFIAEDSESDSADSENLNAEVQVLVDPRRKHHVTARLADGTGALIEYDVPKSIGVDAIYLKRESRNPGNKFGYSYLNCLEYGTEGFFGLQYVLDVERQISNSAEEISRVFRRSNISSSDSLSILVRQSLPLNRIDERIDALKKSEYWFDEGLREEIQSRVVRLEQSFSNLRKRIQKRRDQSHDEVQLKHLSWTRSSAWWIAALAVSQIVLAVLSVNWSESGRSQNNLYSNWKSISSLFQEK
ncbi:hypothetical protein [Pseudomonas juntendi]|uniref:Uncharacterized protein n=1 Tax=Pseudomonas juntendi TaxID=2666183 RepID=A0A7W2LTZ8_9PSED|nr:hypothetical protein [Pseudomonas juntendi]MBA6131349.1 hypothetical protein [Pseudomonas juntendi]MBA6146871.1 hypothetical protein [Pseudomonas juntendi]